MIKTCAIASSCREGVERGVEDEGEFEEGGCWRRGGELEGLTRIFCGGGGGGWWCWRGRDVGRKDGDVEGVILELERGAGAGDRLVRDFVGGGQGESGGGDTCLPITPMHAIEGDFDRGDGVGICYFFFEKKREKR